MKILHVIDLISQKTGGGTAAVVYHLSREQAKLGHEVTIFSSDHDSVDQQPPPGVNLVKFHNVHYLFGTWSLTPKMLFANFKQFDIVHLHNYRVILNMIAAMKGRKVILQAHGNCQPIPSRVGAAYKLLFRPLVFNRCSGYIADAPLEISHFMAEGAMPSKIKIIPVGIDIEEYSNLPARNNHNKKQILFMGKMYWIKGPDLLAKAIAELDRKDIEFVVASIDYGYEAAFRKLIKELNIESITNMVGSKHGAEKIQTFVDADIYVMPSYYEMWGIAFMEALACGTPVLMTKNCEAWTELPPYCGMSVNATPKDIARALNFALDNKLADKDRQKRIEWVKKYDWSIIAKRTIEYYEKVLEK